MISAQRHAAAGAAVYEYQFEQSLPGRERDGAAHTYELPYGFGNLQTAGPLGAAFTAQDRALSDVMLTYWTNFAKRGDPNGPSVPPWPRFTTAAADYVRFSSALPGDVAAAQGLRRQACELLLQKLAARP